MRTLLAAVVVVAGAGTAGAEALNPVANFGANPGALAMYEYVPANLGAKRPLVVVMHGCTQQASAMMSAGWDALADQYGFAVIYPEQSTANNPVRCFNWAGEYGDPANLERGKGENASILSMIDTAIAAHDLDPDRVYVTGISAGGAFTAVMMATFPERFKAGAIFAGIPYRCATTQSGAFSCTNPGVTKTAAQWGDLVRAASSNTAFPRVQIWQGTADTTVATANAGELVKQWTDVHGIDATADATDTIDGQTRTQFKSGSTVVVERYEIAGMGHAIPIGGADCPSTAGAYFSDQGICSTVLAAEFFGLTGDDGNGNGNGNGSGSGSGSGSGDDDSGDMTGGCSTTSGCSTTPATGLGLVLLALGLLVSRRRR